MKTAIIVDDEKHGIELIEYIIESYNIQLEIVDICDNGLKAFESINNNLPDLVFMDIEMPIMNGLEVIEKANKTILKKIEFIIITAYDKFEYAQKALRLGAKDILLKPIQIECLLGILNELLENKMTNNDFFNEILEYINKNYTSEIILQDLAKNFSTSSSYISKLFKKHLGISFVKYVNSKRINRSINLLLDTDKVIKEIAYVSGFNNLNHFYVTFKEITGVTPKEYRDKYK